MNMNFKQLFISALLLLSGFMMANANLNLPIKTIGNEAYYYYKVGGNEDLNKIAKKLGIGVDDIICYNPSASQGVTKKQILFFPVSAFKGDSKSHQVTIKKENVTHVVKSGETLYGISKLYDIPIDELTTANPQAYAGVRAGDVLSIPLDNQVTGTSADEGNYIFHTILKGESMYNVSKLYNTTIESLLALNPGIYPNNFIEGDVIKVAPNTAKEITVNKDITQFYTYEVKYGDTYQSVARANNIPIDRLKQANPNLKKLKEGKVIYIPKDGTTTARINSSAASEKELEQTYSQKMDRVYNDVNKVKKDNEINLAIILPFQLHKNNPPRQAYLYTDFYKGFLLAVDSIGNKAGKKVNLNVYDTEHNLNVTDSLLALSQMKKMDVIIAPGEPKQLQRCNKFGKENGITIANCFSSKNDDYSSNSKVLQINMPTSYMMAAVNNWIDSNFKDYNVIFLEDPTNNDVEIYKSIKDHFSNKVRYQTIAIVNSLDYNTLTQYLDPGSNYLFIPTSSSRTFLDKIAGAVKEVKTQRYDCEISMLGQPDYLTYLKDYKSTFQAIDTYIFSRFFIANEKRNEKLQSKFYKTYKEKMINTFPSMGLLGFDLGMYVINTLGKNSEINGNTPLFDGIQMDLDFDRASNWGGLINRCIELVHLKGNNMTESIIK